MRHQERLAGVEVMEYQVVKVEGGCHAWSMAWQLWSCDRELLRISDRDGSRGWCSRSTRCHGSLGFGFDETRRCCGNSCEANDVQALDFEIGKRDWSCLEILEKHRTVSNIQSCSSEVPINIYLTNQHRYCGDSSHRINWPSEKLTLVENWSAHGEGHYSSKLR